MSTVRVATVKRDDIGSIIGVETRDVDSAVLAQQEAAEQRAAAIAEARSLAGYEQTRDWLVRQIEITFAACEGPYQLVAERQPIPNERDFSAIVLNRVTRAFRNHTKGDAAGEDLFVRSIPAGEEGKHTRSMVGFIDARVELQMTHLKKRLSSVEHRGVPLGEYRGVWRAGEVYPRGDIATDRGSSWIVLTPSADRPGGGSANWRLFDKGDVSNANRKHKGAVKV